MATPTYSGLSYTFYSGDGTTKNFGTLFSYIDKAHITITVATVVQTEGTDYEILNEAVLFTEAPASTAEIRIRRVTPRQYSARAVDFKSFGSITETEMDLNQKQVWFMIQESLEEDDGGEINPNAEYLQWDPTGASWTAIRSAALQRIANVDSPDTATDAATKGYVDDIAEFGIAGIPQAWEFVGTGATGDFSLSGGVSLNAYYLVVAIEGVVQRPITDFIVTPGDPASTLSFGAAFPEVGTVISVQNFGKARFLNTLILSENSVGSFEIKTDGVTAINLADDAVDTAAVLDAAITTDKVADAAVTEAKLADDTVSFDKLKDTGFVTPAPLGSFDQYLKVDKDTGNITVSSALTADLGDWLTALGNVPLSALAAPTTNINLNSKLINSLGTPATGTDAATKAYVDAQVSSGVGSKIDLVYTAGALGGSYYVPIWTTNGPSWHDASTYLYYTVTLTNVQWNSNDWIYLEISTNGTTWVNVHRDHSSRRHDTDFPFTYSWYFNIPADSSTKFHTNFLIGNSGGGHYNHSVYGIPNYMRFRFETQPISGSARVLVYGHKI